MLNCYPPLLPNASEAFLDRAIWIDLNKPSDEEVQRVEQLTGKALPSLDALNEIQASRRLRNEDGILRMSTPSAAMHPGEAQVTPPLGFLLSRDRLITVRFMSLPTFDAVAARFAAGSAAPSSGGETFVALCEEIVDRVAELPITSNIWQRP